MLGILLLLFPQTAIPLSAQPAVKPQLKIIILEGEGAINNIRQRTAREPIVQIEDENRKPVAGALVLFSSPERGPGLIFADGSRTAMVFTDSKGQAVARGGRPNQASGSFEMKVTASYQGSTASAVIHQSNLATKVGAAPSGKMVAILGAIGAVAATAVILGIRDHDTSQNPAPAPTTVVIGTPIVGSP